MRPGSTGNADIVRLDTFMVDEAINNCVRVSGGVCYFVYRQNKCCTNRLFVFVSTHQ
jgi:hypothetical protein